MALVYAVLAGHRRATWVAQRRRLRRLRRGLARSTRDAATTSRGCKASLVAGWLIVVLAVAELIRSRRDAFRSGPAPRRRSASVASGEQRLELAQELHDVLAHHISLINVQAGVALHLIDEQPERARPALADIKDASREALRELRGALDILRRGEAAPRSPAPRLADLDRLVATVAPAASTSASTTDGRPDELPAAVELAAYRIVQEALTNVSRHAAARSAHGAPALRRRRRRSRSPTTASAARRAAGNGIAGMRERAAALGGAVEAGPAPGGRLPGRRPAADRGAAAS